MFKKLVVLLSLVLSLISFEVFSAPSTLDELKAMHTLVKSDLNKNKIATATAAFSTATIFCSGIIASLCTLNPLPLGLASAAASAGPSACTVKFTIALVEKKFILKKIAKAMGDYLKEELPKYVH